MKAFAREPYERDRFARVAEPAMQARSADRILVIEAGVLVDSGTHDDLVRRCPLYATLAGEFADAA